ncbi:hypothetical protein U1Q18_043398, partial [Sarracenia purpurea var. burkii]
AAHVPSIPARCVAHRAHTLSIAHRAHSASAFTAAAPPPSLCGTPHPSPLRIAHYATSARRLVTAGTSAAPPLCATTVRHRSSTAPLHRRRPSRCHPSQQSPSVRSHHLSHLLPLPPRSIVRSHHSVTGASSPAPARRRQHCLLPHLLTASCRLLLPLP